MTSPRTPLLVLALVALSACGHAGPRSTAEPATNGRCPEGRQRFVATREYLARLPPPPLTVGLDVDDTGLFSTPAFLHAKGRILPRPPGSEGSPEQQAEAWRAWYRALEERREAIFQRIVGNPREALGEEEQAAWSAFWDDVNTTGDSFSPPKASARAIVRAHLERGDRVIFVTARPVAEIETLGSKLRADFGSDDIGVEFTAMRPKAEILRSRGISVYYGDSDGDMVDATAAGAVGVRVFRSGNSSNRGTTHVGERGECWVLEGSDL